MSEKDIIQETDKLREVEEARKDIEEIEALLNGQSIPKDCKDSVRYFHKKANEIYDRIFKNLEYKVYICIAKIECGTLGDKKFKI